MKCLSSFAFCFFTLLACPGQFSTAAPKHPTEELNYPQLVLRFYEIKSGKLAWFEPGSAWDELRHSLKRSIDSLIPGESARNLHSREIEKYIDASFTDFDSANARMADRIFTDAALTFGKLLYQGEGIAKLITFDELSDKREPDDNEMLVRELANVNTSDDLQHFFELLEPGKINYKTLTNYLNDHKDSLTPVLRRQLLASQSLERWMYHFQFAKRIVVNIASATLRYFENDSLLLSMKVVVGKPSTRTPRFAAHCNQIILYPYWNVPASIAVKELLPVFKKDPGAVDDLNMQIIDKAGNIIDHKTLNWRKYSSGYFPFRVRQSTGCDNSLGIIKFDLTSPYSVYLHDTNYKAAFQLQRRFLSHGCIRLEKPVELANFILPTPLDPGFLSSCLKQQLPVNIDLPDAVPVFVIYQPVEMNVHGGVTFYKDVYQLFN